MLEMVIIYTDEEGNKTEGEIYPIEEGQVIAYNIAKGLSEPGIIAEKFIRANGLFNMTKMKFIVYSSWESDVNIAVCNNLGIPFRNINVTHELSKEYMFMFPFGFKLKIIMNDDELSTCLTVVNFEIVE